MTPYAVQSLQVSHACRCHPGLTRSMQDAMTESLLFLLLYTVVSLYVECISSFMHVQICGFENFLQLKRCMDGCTVAIGHHAEEGIGCLQSHIHMNYNDEPL